MICDKCEINWDGFIDTIINGNDINYCPTCGFNLRTFKSGAKQ